MGALCHVQQKYVLAFNPCTEALADCGKSTLLLKHTELHPRSDQQAYLCRFEEDKDQMSGISQEFKDL